MELEYIEIYLDSRDSVVTTPAYANTDWPTFRFQTPIQNIAKMKILEAEIPFSYYVVNTDNNRIVLTETGSSTAVIPVGNYTVTDLATALGAALTAASLALGSRTYTVTYSTITGRFTISSSGTFTLSVSSLLLQSVLGLQATNPSSGSTLVAPHVAMVTGPNYVYANSDSLGPSFQTYLPSTATQFPLSKGPQMARIPVTDNPGAVSYYQDPVPEKWFDTQNLLQLQQLDMYFTLGNTNEKIRFQGQHFSIKLGLLIRTQVHSRFKDTAGYSTIRSVMG